MKWYNDRTLLINFGTALMDAEVLEDTADIKSFFARPYRYDDMYDTWKEFGFPMEDDENWEEFVAEVTNENDDEEETEEEEEDNEESESEEETDEEEEDEEDNE